MTGPPDIPAGRKRAPWRCRHGWHRWLFLSMTSSLVRMAGPGPLRCWEVWTYCERCHLRRCRARHTQPRRICKGTISPLPEAP